MGDLILHIGTTKTGTTALQKFFFKNRAKLAAHGVSFPMFTNQSEASRIRNGYFFNRYCLNLAKEDDPGFGIENLQKNLNLLTKHLRAGNRILLSDETMYTFSNSRNHVAQPYWPTMAHILDKAGAETLTFVLYLRRQDDWVASAWRQICKTGRENRELSDYCRSPWVRRLMDYANTVEAIERSFGNAARIVIRHYDRESFAGGDIYRDFCAACGIPWDGTYQAPAAETNISLSFDVADALRVFKDDAQPRTPLRTDILIPLARELSDHNPDAPGTTPFDEEATRTLMEPYLEGNRQLSERYFGGEPLFSSEYGGRPVWVPNEEHIAAYRVTFEEAIWKHSSSARRSPEGAIRLLRATGKKLRGR